MSLRSTRWARGSAERNERRRICREKGLCTKCYGVGTYRCNIDTDAGPHTLVEMMCSMCHGTGKGPPGIK